MMLRNVKTWGWLRPCRAAGLGTGSRPLAERSSLKIQTEILLVNPVKCWRNVRPKVKLVHYPVKSLRDKAEVWCHTCWGNPSQQRMFKEIQSYAPALEHLNQVDADVITFESCSSGRMDLEAIGRQITEKKVAIGVIDHHSLQVEKPEDVADHIREALRHIPAERLVIASDCGMGREGMARRHARYKMVSLVLGTNMVKKELGLPEAECLAADGRYSLVKTE